MLSAAQLDRINHIRDRAGRNPVTMEQAQILLGQMNEAGRAQTMLAIGEEAPLKPVQTCEDRIAAAVAAERERCAVAAESERVSGDTGDESDESYNMACKHIADRIRSGQ